MKNYLIGLSLFICVISVAQQPNKNFDSIYKTEEWKSKYAKAAREAADETNHELADEIVELTSTGLYNRLDPKTTPVDHVITNDAALPEFLTEFYTSAIYHRVDYAPELVSLKKVVLIQADLNFLGTVIEIEGGYEIWLNSKLLLFPNLYYAIFYHQMGVLYDLPEDKNSKNLDFMSDRWEISPKYENWAYNRRQRSTQKNTFFEKLAKKHPLKKQL